jgi:diguanylate cyclase (GGDEF)-like protein
VDHHYHKALTGEHVIFEDGMTIGVDQSHHWIVNLIPDYAEDQTVQGLFISVLDITERKVQEQKISRLSRMQAMHSAISSAVVRIHDRQALLFEVCRIVVEQTNLGMAWVALADEDANEMWAAAWWGGFDGNALENYRVPIMGKHTGSEGAAVRAIRDRQTVVINHIDDDPHVGYIRLEAVKNNYQSVIGLPLIIDNKAIGALILYASESNFFNQEEVQLLEDLTLDISVGLEYLSKTQHINYLAYYDELTGLPNRVRLLERLELKGPGSRAKVQPRAVALIDIARFRLINDSFGRASGDDIIKLVAARLRSAVVNAENCARIESNCFSLVLEELGGGPEAEAQTVAALEAILQQVFASPFRLAGHEFHLKAKCGVAIIRSGSKFNIELVMRQAELALQNAKKSVESVLFYRSNMDERSAEALNMEIRLRRALDNGEFVLHYQPKLNVADQSIKSVEALIRWQDPETGLVPPALFIPVLEKTGMIFEVGRWVLRQAAADYQRWLDKGIVPPRIAVNVSALQLGHHHFVPDLKRLVAGRAGGAHGIDLEITESVIMDNLDENIVKLKAARELGMGLAIDDFGTGYSSLSYLSRLPVNVLKIDRFFIVEMTTGEPGKLLVASIITLAHTLKLEVVAEGVETQEQRDLLTELGCDQIQGYLISKPLPAAELEKILLQYEEMALAR